MNACFRHKRALALHVTWAHHEWQMHAASSVIPTDRLAAVMRELSCLQLTLYTLSLQHRGNSSIYKHFSFCPSCSRIQNKVNLTWRAKIKICMMIPKCRKQNGEKNGFHHMEAASSTQDVIEIHSCPPVCFLSRCPISPQLRKPL